MIDFLKVTAGVLVALLLHLALGKQGAHFSTMLSIAVCCIVLFVTASYLSPVIEFIDDLEQIANTDSQAMEIMIRSVGIGLLAEITAMICSDAGNAAMGKVLQVLASAVILYLAIPLFTTLMDVVEEILVAL